MWICIRPPKMWRRFGRRLRSCTRRLIRGSRGGVRIIGAADISWRTASEGGPYKRKKHKKENKWLAGELVEEFAGDDEVFEAFFFGAKFRGVRDEAAAGAAGGMLDVQHLVIENVLDDRLRDARAIHATVEDDLI